MRIALLITAAALCSAATADAQAVWSEVTGLGTNIPATRRESPGAADLSSMYVFGGQDGAGARLNDLWQFDGSAWTELTADGAVGSPPGRSRAAIAWDVGNGQLVVFGGNDGTTTLGDTWTWDTTAGWVVHSPVASPQALQFAQLAHDPVNDYLLLFGGQDSAGTDQSETWSWNGTNWTQLAPATVPPARRQHGMAARPDQGDIVMCCGQDSSGKLNDTYLWNGTDWNLVTTTVTPQPVVAMDMTYDEVRQRVLIPGGNNMNGNPIGTIAEFDGTDWVNLPKDPVILKRTRYFLAFVPSLGRSYMFGGQQVSASNPTGTFQYYDPNLEPGTGYCFGDLGSGTACPCGNDNDGSVPGSGCANGVFLSGAKLTGSGTASLGADTLVLAATGLDPNNSGLYFQANDDLSPGILWGDGLQCAGGALKRLGVRFSDPTGASDTSAWTTSISVRAGNVLAGDTKHYQLWYRDTSGGQPCGVGINDFNSTNGYAVTWTP